jgi:hypothetical protein
LQSNRESIRFAETLIQPIAFPHLAFFLLFYLQKIAEIDSIVADGLLALLQSCRSSVFF